MVKKFDFEQLSGPDEIPSKSVVGFGRCAFAAWVIVHHDDGICSGSDGDAKYFAGVNEQRVLCADGK